MSAPDRTRVNGPYPDQATQYVNGAALFGGPVRPSSTPPDIPRHDAAEHGDGVDYSDIRDSAEFAELRRRVLRFVVPVTALFMANFMLFVLLSAYAPDLMGTPVIGLINAGILVGVFQFVTTVAIVVGYGRYAREHVDPLADRIRDEVEGP